MVRVTVPVTVELPAPSAEVSASVARGLGAGLSELLDGLGVPGHPRVRVVNGTSSRVVRFRVFGRVVPYPRPLMLRAWRAVAPPELHDLARRDAAGEWRGFPDDWMRDVPSHGADLLPGLVCRLGLETIKTKPGCLMAPEVAAAYAPGVRAPMDLLAAALARILDLGLSLAHRRRVMETLASAYRLRVSLEDAAEAVFDQMRSDVITVSVPPDHAQEPAPGAADGGPPLAAELRRRLPILRETLAAEFGITNQLELLVERVAGEMEIGVRINDQTSVVPIVRPDEILLAESPTRLEQRGVRGRGFSNPATSADCTVVAATMLPEVERQGIAYWTPAGFVALVVYAEVRRLAHRVISAEEVQRRLVRLGEAAPALVSAVLSRFTVWDVVRVMRGLASEGIAPRDLELILQLLVRFDALPVEEDGLQLFDDRPPIGEQGREADSEALLRWVRRGLRRQITERCAAGRDFLVALRLPEGPEARLSPDGRPDLQEVESDALLDSLWDGLALLPDAGDVRPVVLTSARARASVRALVRDELPEVPVIGEDEVLPDVRVCALFEREGRMHAQVAITADRVGKFLEQFADRVLSTSTGGAFDVIVDGTPVRVTVVGEADRTVVEVVAVTNRGVPISERLFRWLAEHGQDSRFGHLRCRVGDEVATVECRYALLGDYLDYEELRLAVHAVSSAGAAARAHVEAEFGGEPAVSG